MLEQIFFHEADFIDTGYNDIRIDLQFFLRYFALVIDLRQEVLDAIETRQLLIVGSNDPPRRQGSVGFVEHLELSDGVIVPFILRLPVYRRDFILLQRIGFPGIEPPQLLGFGDGKKIFKQFNMI